MTHCERMVPYDRQKLSRCKHLEILHNIHLNVQVKSKEDTQESETKELGTDVVSVLTGSSSCL